MLSIEVRIMLVCIMVSFILTLLGGMLILPTLKSLKAGQSIRELGPDSHKAKAGTPTMGGIILIISISLVCFFITKDPKAMYTMIGTVLFGLIGFLDDFIKVVMKRNLGLRAWQKIVGLLLGAGIMLYLYSAMIGWDTTLLIPFGQEYYDFGIFFIPFTVLVILFGVNAVNLTDGLDGLVTGVSIPVAMFFAGVGLVFSDKGIIVAAAALLGALLGFLRYNAHPAEVFMGDTGSFAIGGAIISLGIASKLQLFLVIAGLIYMIEALSVVIQVAYFKYSGGKRIFKMTPIHHHFELSGWKETKVTAVFGIISYIVCVVALMGLSK